MTKNTKHQNSNLTPVGPGATSQGKRAGRPGLRQELSGEIRYRPTQSEHPPRLLPTKAAGKAGEGSTPCPSPAPELRHSPFAFCEFCRQAVESVDEDGQCLTCAALGWWIEGMASWGSNKIAEHQMKRRNK